jgi:SNF2 family DNA or RNA helicase
MGLGKTVQSLRALPTRARAIVLCPASVLMVWREEVHRWRPDLRVGQLRDRAPREREILLCSYDALRARGFASSCPIQDDLSNVTLILDEPHRVRNGEALRTIQARRLREQCANVWGLTGTPMVGNIDDLSGLLQTLGLFEEAFPGGDGEFIELCAKAWVNRRRVKLPEVRRRLGRVMLRRRRASLLDLPPAKWIDVPCDAPEDLRDHMDEITEAWEDYDPDDLPSFEMYSAATAALARARTDAAVSVAAKLSQSRPTLVFSAHLDPIYAVTDRLSAVCITGAETTEDRSQAAEEFRSGRAKILCATLQAGGEGLNFPEAGAALLIDQSYLPGETDQAISRMLRPGQVHRDVLVYKMVTDHPLDERVNRIVDRKRLEIDVIVG